MIGSPFFFFKEDFILLDYIIFECVFIGLFMIFVVQYRKNNNLLFFRGTSQSMFEKVFCKIYRKVRRADCGNDFQTGSRSRFEDKQDMKETNVYTKIITDENLMETIPHGSQDYPFRYYYEHLAQFDFNCIDWHWHTELEFVYVQSGTVTAWIGENSWSCHLTAAFLLIPNSFTVFPHLWMLFIPNFLCMPSFLVATDSYIYQNYVKPIISSNIPFWIFRREISWQARVLDLMKQIISAQTSGSFCHLLTSSLMQQLWLEIYKHTDLSTSPEITGQFSVNRARLQLMMQFIHENYRRNLSLDEIAAQSMISKSSALNLFRSYLHITPVNYLINYRLKQAALLLSHTEKKSQHHFSRNWFSQCRLFLQSFQKTLPDNPWGISERKVG